MTLNTSQTLFPLLPALFSLALFLGAGLLFIVELMIAKMILPLLGGTPAVWNTCMMFFQALLLIGYAYAHIISRKAGVTRQIILHLVVFLKEKVLQVLQWAFGSNYPEIRGLANHKPKGIKRYAFAFKGAFLITFIQESQNNAFLFVFILRAF